MHRYRQLMVALARTDADAGLIQYAAMVARLGTAEKIRFVHVAPPAPGAAMAPEHDRIIAELQAKVRPQLTGLSDKTQVAFDVVSGPLMDQLLVHAAEKQIDLLLVGHRVESSGRRALARRLAMNAPCSVWMVPDGSPASLDRILAPIDFSEHSADSMRVAVSMARLSGAKECLALHVYFNEAVATYEGYDVVLRGQEEQAFQQFIAPINCLDVAVRPLFEEGANIAHAIGRAAAQHNADLIVMATRGRSRSAAILLGSVTEQLLMETRIPLLAVKHFGARMGVLQALLDRRFWHQGNLRTD